jgi:two-component system chemotaxis response regulator CheY
MHETKKGLNHETEKVLDAAGEDEVVLAKPDAQELLSAARLLEQMAVDVNRHVKIDFREDIARLSPLSDHRQTQDPLNPIGAKAQSSSESRPVSPEQDASATTKKTAADDVLRILVAEDDFTSRIVLQRLLSKYGEIDVAVDGREAVEAFQQARCDGRGYNLICMDIRLPKIDGTEAARQIRSIEASEGVPLSLKVKIFMTTAIRDLKTVDAAYKALCDTYLFKPIDGVQLQDHMRAFGLIDKVQVA